MYQADQQKYLAGMMRGIVSKPQSNGAIEERISTGLKTPPDIVVNRTPALKKINCPTLSMPSAKSGSLAQQQARARQISGAHFETVEDAVHALFLDQPDRFNELVRGFVAKLAPNDDVNGARTVTTPAPFVESDQPVISTLEQYRAAPEIVKARQWHRCQFFRFWKHHNTMFLHWVRNRAVTWNFD